MRHLNRPATVDVGGHPQSSHDVVSNTQGERRSGATMSKTWTLAMKIRLVGAAWLVTLAGCSTVLPGTPGHTALSHDDVSFYKYSFEEKPRVWNNATCGFLIQGNSYSWQVPRPEWTISVYEVMDNDMLAVEVEVAAFGVVSTIGKPRRKCSAIAGPSLLIANISGSAQQNEPERSTRTLETAPAEGLFRAFSQG